ncbi:MAG: hypothetical protein AB7O24_32425 [Kofleriaceae bacterium]
MTAAVLIALANVGLGVQLEEQLNRAGVKSRWDAEQVDGPRGTDAPMVVLTDADHLGPRLAEVLDRWRDQPSVPGVVAVGNSPAAREHAPGARVTLVAPTAKLQTMVEAIRQAAKLRLAAGMRWRIMRAACNLPPCADEPSAWQATMAAARRIDIDIPRATLRWHVGDYATETAKLKTLRDERLLTVPELEISKRFDGTWTVQRMVKTGPHEPSQVARLLWMLGSMEAVDFTPEVRDSATAPRRALAEVRAHIRARMQRLERSTYYDVLEITPLAEFPQIEEAHRLLTKRFAPDVLNQHDLGELAVHVQPIWDLIEKARLTLVDDAARGRYHDWLRAKLPELRTVWAIDPPVVTSAATAFARGQKSLGDGDVHRAMSELAIACRQFPGHPEYEANFAWARYRVQVASGRDRIEAAVAERKTIEDLLVGCKPWPRALVALALLCAAGGDADSARWHLHTALTVDPSVPAAAQLAQRLGMRR